MDPFSADGVAAGTETLLKLRFLARAERAGHRRLTGMPGGFVSRRRGRGLEADDIRVYFEGDDIRHIDRNVTARTGVPHVRTFRDERDRTILLVADFRPSMLWGTRRAFRSVAAAEALALSGWKAVDAGARVGLLAFGAGEPVFVPARSRERGMIAVAGGLASAHRAAFVNGDESALESALEKAGGLVPAGGTIVLATGLDNPGPGFDMIEQQLCTRARLIVLLIVDAFENAPPKGRYAYTTDGQQSRWASIGARRLEGIDERAAHLQRLGVEYSVIDAAAGPELMETPDG
jgi:uncharacterized protein (DUF58 family)